LELNKNDPLITFYILIQLLPNLISILWLLFTQIIFKNIINKITDSRLFKEYSNSNSLVSKTILYNLYLKTYKMSINDFEFLGELGKGSFGLVYKVRRKQDNNIYALKKVEISKLNQKEKENSLNEIRILASVTSPHVISFKESFYDSKENTLCLVMEYADGGDLDGRINNNIQHRTNFKEKEIWDYFSQVVHGLKALHDKHIMHRDLKCANVFLNKSGEVKIGDMNVSKVMKLGLLCTQTGTPYYASPEVWKDKPYDFKSDIWSLGCMLYEMCCLKPPFRGNSMEQVYNKVIKGQYERIPETFSKELRSLISILLQVNPANRPNIDQVITILGNFKVDSTTKNKDLLSKEPAESFSCDSYLLNTIRVPRNIREINALMPKPNYQSRNKRY
jgi:NIMA (never in mitosis gene a)-related kinase